MQNIRLTQWQQDMLTELRKNEKNWKLLISQSPVWAWKTTLLKVWELEKLRKQVKSLKKQQAEIVDSLPSNCWFSYYLM